MRLSRLFVLLAGLLLIAPLVLTFAYQTQSAHAAAPCSKGGCPINSCPPTQSENNPNNNSSWVEVIQYSLNSFSSFGSDVILGTLNGFMGSTKLSVDGRFGSSTKNAVVAFQERILTAGSYSKGVVDTPTWEAMGLCTNEDISAQYTFIRQTTQPWVANSGYICPPTQSEGSRSNQPVLVQAAQDILNRNQYAAGGSFVTTHWQSSLVSDGSFGSQTAGAVQDWTSFASTDVPHFQTTKEINQQVWMSLNMCYKK